MIYNINAHSVIPQHFFEKGEKNYWPSCFNLSWDKIVFFSDLALLVSEIALGFFLNLPPVFLFSFGVWRVVNILLYAQVNHPSSSAEVLNLNQKIESLREENDVLRKNWNEKTAMEDQLPEEISTLQTLKENLIADIKKAEEKLASQKLKSD